MLLLLSPAKTLDLAPIECSCTPTQPGFLDHAAELIECLRAFTPADIASLMKISDSLAQLNFTRFASWSGPFTPENAKPALFAFAGDVYEGLQADRFDKADLDFAQKHVRILSGLYGLLRPLDLMQAYRLEMGSRLVNPRGQDLYTFWGDLLTQAINQELLTHAQPFVINLASEEYFKVIRPRILHYPVVTPQFLDFKNGQYKIISFYAKKARGTMTRYVVQNRIDDCEALKNFDLDGYRFSPDRSGETQWIFLRD